MFPFLLFIPLVVNLCLTVTICDGAKFYLLEEQPINTTVGAENSTATSYKFVSNQDVDGFWVDSKTGTIYTSKVFDRESLTKDQLRNGFQFYIEYKMNKKKNFWSVTIFITDINDHVPRFKQAVHDLSVNEDVDLNKNIRFPAAIDADIGNNAVTLYNIVSGDKFRNFRVHKTSLYDDRHEPFLTVISLLDLEDQSDNIILNISACDDQSKLCSYGLLNITVLDVNDHKPVFTKNIYFVHVNENSPVGTKIYQIKATDKDRGKNAKITFQVGKNVNKFSINPDTGELTVHGTLDAEEVNSHNVVVIATDQGEPPLTSTAVVRVYVNDINDNKPEVKVIYSKTGRYNVLEGAKIGTEVAKLEVIDRDVEAKNRKVKVKLSKTEEYFHIVSLNNSTNQQGRNQPEVYSLQVKKDIDRELTPEFIVKVRAVDSGTPKKRELVNIRLLVGDINDNRPQISLPYYTATVSEASSAGFNFLNITASDADLGKNRQIRFSIVSDTSNSIQINPTTGELSLLQPIDRETMSKVFVNVSATDHGFPSLTSFAYVNISIQDVNDNNPYFQPSKYNFNITENNEPSVYIGQVFAFDQDIVGSNSLLYHINDSNFLVKSKTGKIYTKTSLDREKQAVHNLKVFASDADGNQGYCYVRVKINDVNDESPRFSQNFYNLSIHKNFPVGKVAVYVSAVDLDEGVNAEIIYSAKFNDNTFSIDPNNGGVILKKDLNSQKKVVFSFTVSAVDRFGRKAVNTATVQLHVLPASLLQPVFQKKNYIFNVTENNKVNEVIGHIIAERPSSGSTTLIAYRIISGNTGGMFNINQFGELSAVKVLDHEDRLQYNLTIQAMDTLNTMLKTSTTVQINVLDLNDNQPTFTMQSNVIEVSEGLPIGYVIMKCTTIDLDSGNNAEMHIEMMNITGPFAVSNTTGQVYTTGTLDYETTKLYSIYLQVFDHGEPSLSSELKLTIKILDMNDNQPVFTNLSFVISVNEDFKVGQPITNITATDADSGKNGVLFFNLLPSDDAKSFFLNNHGKLFLKEALDRETKDSYQIQISAHDMGNPSQRAETWVRIVVEDFNDEKPTFEKSSYVFELYEESPQGTIVGEVIAIDKDIGSNGVVSYSLFNADDNFVITKRHQSNRVICVIMSNKQFDSEVDEQSYTLTIIAEDGKPSNIERVLVEVKIKNINDHAPRFSSTLPYLACITQGTFENTKLTQIVAKDTDAIPLPLEYSLILLPDDTNIAMKLLKISPNTGEVYTKTKINLPSETVLNITIQVKEVSLTEATLSNYQKLIVIIAPSKPSIMFKKNCVHVNVKETMNSNNVEPLGVELNRLTNNNYKINKYDFITKDPNEVLPFEILRKTGIITLASRVHHRSYPYYILNVTATGTRNNKIQTDSILLFIFIIPRNYYSPSYPNNPERYEIPEDWQALKVFDTLKIAQDKDDGVQGSCMYSIVETSPVDAPLRISPLTRQIMFTKPIDRELVGQYVLKVRITDLALDVMTRLSQTFTIYVSVKDINDNKPVFLSNTNVDVYEDSPVGSIVTTVQAKDPDQGETNTDLAYEIISGDDDNAFTLGYFNGHLTIAKTLDIYKTNIHHLQIRTIELRDPNDPENIPSFNSTTSLSIKVIDVNNKVPKFTQDVYKVNLLENQAVGSFVLQVNSTDDDIDPVNKKVVYELLNNDDLFSIDSNSGVITTKSVHDREQDDFFQVDVSVRNIDNNDDESICVVNISIDDENDHAPEFPSGTRLELHILENTPSFEFHKFQTVDQDIGSNAIVTYSMYPNLTEFDINSKSGSMVVTISLDREIRSSYDFMVIAENVESPYQKAFQNVTIIVDDQNDEKPHFEIKSHTLEVYEDTLIHQNILMTLKAVDKDEGSNAVILYSIVSPSCPLTIDSNSGTIKLAEPLDYENCTSYTCVVNASGPGEGFFDTTVVNVHVIDTNDNYPQFSKQLYRVNVDKIQVEKPIFTVKATDADENGTQSVAYELSPAHDFHIQLVSGEIYIKRLNIPPGHYRTRVTAKDFPKGKRKGSSYPYPSKRSQATILITVGNLTDSTLRFLNKSVEFNISESTIEKPLTNYSFGFLKAVSTQNNSIDYSITPGSNPEKAFAISNTGELYVNNSDAVDHEKHTMFFLRILATTTLSTGSEISILLSVLIKLNDLNDNAPVIFPQNITFSYPETSEDNFQPFMVYYFHVRDDDRRDFQKLKFEIYSGNDDNVFGLTGFSFLYINKSIDYEKKQNYHIVLRASDTGYPVHHTYSHIYINLEDQNDNPPVLTNLDDVHIQENSLIGTIVTTISATDVDIVTSIIRYGLLPDQYNSKIFEIDELTGVIRLAHFRLDYETKKLYTLRVSAFDGIFTTYGTLNVHVIDDNDNIPQFTESVYSVNVSRTLKKNKHIIQVVANDLDSGMLGSISYKLDPKHLRDAFTIEQNSGNIFTSKDYTFPPDIGYVTLSVIAFDNDGKPISRMSRAIVKMYVSGKESSNPVFMQSIYEKSIEEQASRLGHVGYVLATFTTGVHRTMLYSIVRGNVDDAFDINEKNGLIYVNNDLDREKRDSYSLEILAVVLGHEQLKARCVVNIKILDINDEEPVFLSSQYETTIREDVDVGESLLQVVATDADEPNTENSRITYAIHSGQDEYKWLKIDADTGWVTTARELDREITPKIQLTIMASDGKGNGRHRRYVSLIVTLEDVNDHTPIFNLNLPIKDFKVKENSSIDTIALKVEAYDPDEGNNGKISFMIINSTGMSSFYMKDTHTGWVYTSQVLDYEQQNSYNVTILAYDHGDPRREASFEYRILVEDVNEFLPTFDLRKFEFNVKANAKKSTKIGKVSATDKDGGPYGKVRYTLANPSNFFSIGQRSGILRVTDDLRRSPHASRVKRDLTQEQPYDLVINADNGEGTPSVTTQVSIEINFTCPGCAPITTLVPRGQDNSINASTLVIVLTSVAVFVLILMLFGTVVYCRWKGCYLITKGLYGNSKNSQPRFCSSKEKVVGPSSSVERELLQHSTASSYDPLHFYTDCPTKHDTRLSSETGLIQDTSGGTARSISATDKASTYSFGIYHEQAIPESEMRPFSDNLSTMSNLEQDSVFAYSGKKLKKSTRSCVSRSTQESSLYSLTSNQPNKNLNLSTHNKSTVMSSRSESHESLNDFQEEGGGEAAGGIDVGNLLYAKLSEVDEEEPPAVMDGVRSFRDEGAPPRGHPLSTIIGSDVALNYEGHYNENWRPNVNNVSTVFSDLNHSLNSKPSSSIMSTPSSFQQQMNSKTPKQKLTNDIPLQVLNSNMLSSGRTSMLSSVQSLPRTPVEIPSTYTSGALSPNFTPALTPLVFRTPSVSSVGTLDNFTAAGNQQSGQGFNIGLNKQRSDSVNSQLSRITLSDINVSDDEEQV